MNHTTHTGNRLQCNSEESAVKYVFCFDCSFEDAIHSGSPDEDDSCDSNGVGSFSRLPVYLTLSHAECIALFLSTLLTISIAIAI